MHFSLNIHFISIRSC